MWNRCHFGNILHKKKIIMVKIYGAQKVLLINPSTFLTNLESRLQKDLEEILDQERDLWMLKSRLN